MAIRTFGPVRGAGTQITETDGDKPISPGALGQTAYVGLFEKGDVGKLILLPNKKSFEKKMGGIYVGTQAPDAALDFYDGARGAGALFAVRVTDGTEVAAEIELVARRPLRTVVGKLRAKNGGRWGGKEQVYSNVVAAAGSVTPTTMTTGIATFKADEWKGGYIELDAAASKRYLILGNTAAGVFTVSGDATMRADMGVTPTTLRYNLVLENAGKAVSVQIRDGDTDPTNEWALDVYVDGAIVKTYGRLSSDPLSDVYFVNVINEDTGNDEIFAVDSFSGTIVPDIRPSNGYSTIASVTPTVLTAVVHDVYNNSPTGGNATMVLGTTTDAMLEQKITATFTSPTAFTLSSDRFPWPAPATGALGTPVVSPNKYTPGFTLTAGATPMVSGDTIVINYKPYVPSALVGGWVYPDKKNFPKERYRIAANTHKTVTAADGSDLTIAGATADEFMLVYPRTLRGGRDGHAGVVDATYTKAYDVSLSLLNQLADRGLGLVKLATPGVTATAVQKAGVAYASAKNMQYRVEFPANIVTESAAQDYIDTTIGHSEYSVGALPSYGYVPDPSGKVGNKLATLTGMIHGAEARIAADWQGYHKAAAGMTAVLPKIVRLPIDAALDEEILNPIGIQVIKRKKGNYIIWGDRTLGTNPTWRFKHQREQMSHYENSLAEAFDFIIFAINDPLTQADVLTSLRSFFLPEYNNRALRGTTFDDACVLKVDDENNTDATRADGDLFADITLRLADTVERLRIRIGKQGMFTAAV